MKQTGAVITAAGRSTRMGKNKTFLPVGSLSIIQHIITTLWSADVSPIVVVAGYQAEKLKQHLACYPVTFVYNSNYASTHMFDSAKLGLEWISSKCERVIFTPADIPLFSLRTVERLLETEGNIILPACGTSTGHPIVLSSSVLPQLMAYQGEGGLGGAIRHSRLANRIVPVEDEGILLDTDTPADYQKILRYHNLLRYRKKLPDLDEKHRSFPSENECLRMLDRYGTPEPVRAHCRAVQTLVLEMAGQLDPVLNLGLLSASALLHDIARTEKNHAEAGAEILIQAGYREVARIIRQHHNIQSPQIFDEAALLFLADKLVDGVQYVTLQERFSKSLSKCTTSEAIHSHRRQFMQAIQVQMLYSCYIAQRQAHG